MKKYIALLVAVYLFIGCFSNVVMASDITNPNNTTMSTYKNGFTYNSIDETMLEISEKIHEQKILAPTSISTIKIGTNKTFTAATDADTMQDNNWGSPTIQKMAKISSGGWADCAVNVSGKDANGKAWAYLGFR